MEGHFNYDGTVGAIPDKDCRACASAIAKFCIARPQDPNHNEATCGLCAAVKKGRCETHGRGIQAALDEHKMADPGSQAEYDEAKAFVLKRTSSLKPECRVSIHVSASEAGPEQVAMGGFPREVTVRFRQLDPG